MLGFPRRSNGCISNSRLFNQNTFYKAFEKDLRSCKYEVIIESPFMTTKRVERLLPAFKDAVRQGVRIVVNTRDPYEITPYDAFAVDAIAELQSIGVEVLYTGKHHRKLAVFDRTILWEGSLNILSQYDSCEIMRRICSRSLSEEVINFTGINDYLGY